MIDVVLRVCWETWGILKEASVFLLLGFALAGVLAVLVPKHVLSKLFNTGKVKSVLWASAIGAPLPLCSCGVVPTAIGLKRQGATPGATVAFTIATPETGVDSISLTYALMDPIITVFRPAAAVITAISAGLATNFLGVPRRGAAAADAPSNDTGLPGDRHPPVDGDPHGHGHEHPHQQDHTIRHGHAGDAAHAHGEQHDPADPQPHACGHDHGDAHALHAHHPHEPAHGPHAPSFRPDSNPARRVYEYALLLLEDTSYWLVLGIVLSGLVAAALPPTFFARYLDNELASMLLMLAIGIPIYTCASASTPMAAALIMKGLNPGAALVFLLAGPATNLGSLVVLTKFLGARIIAIYLAAISIVTLAAGFALNRVYQTWQIDPRASFGHATTLVPEPLKVVSALLLIVLLGYSMRRAPVPAEWIGLRDRLARASGVKITRRQLKWTGAALVAGLYAGSGLFTVDPGQAGISLYLGKVTQPPLAPGLHYRAPWPFGEHRVVADRNVRSVELGVRGETSAARPIGGREQLTIAGWNNPTPQRIETRGTWFARDPQPEEPLLLTGDGVLIDLRAVLQYRLKDALAAEFNIADPQALVYSTARAELRHAVATTGIDALYTNARGELEQRIAGATQRMLDRIDGGIEIIAFRLHYVHAPDDVHDAFRDVASAQEDKLRTINRSGIFAVEKVNQAKGEAAAMIEQALAFKQQQILRAQGDAAGFNVRLDEYRRSPDLTKFRLQMETIEESLPGVQKFVRPGVTEMKDLDLWLLQPPMTGKK